MSKADNLSAQNPFTIPVGTDFNGLVQPGTYQLLWYDATAQNTPTGGNACQLAVSRIAEKVILQTCTVWRGGLVYETYQRIREYGTWAAWVRQPIVYTGVFAFGVLQPGEEQLVTVSLPSSLPDTNYSVVCNLSNAYTYWASVRWHISQRNPSNFIVYVRNDGAEATGGAGEMCYIVARS